MRVNNEQQFEFFNIATLSAQGINKRAFLMIGEIIGQ